jgi:short-subunit dehydrogenase
MDLVLVALPSSDLGLVAQEIGRRHGVRAACYLTDLTAPGSPEALAQWLAEKGFAISALINNAGVGYNGRFADSTLRENEECILLNNLATVKLTHLLLPELQRHPRAFLLNVASLAAFFPMPFMPVYAPSKAFLVNFSLALREELRGTPVRVSVLCPNGIRTNASCRERIKAGGVAARLTCMDAGPVAARAVRGMLAGRPVIVPGALNQALAAVSKVVPLVTIAAVVSAFWGRTAGLAQDLPAPPETGGGEPGPARQVLHPLLAEG